MSPMEYVPRQRRNSGISGMESMLKLDALCRVGQDYSTTRQAMGVEYGLLRADKTDQRTLIRGRN